MQNRDHHRFEIFENVCVFLSSIFCSFFSKRLPWNQNRCTVVFSDLEAITVEGYACEIQLLRIQNSECHSSTHNRTEHVMLSCVVCAIHISLCRAHERAVRLPTMCSQLRTYTRTQTSRRKRFLEIQGVKLGYEYNSIRTHARIHSMLSITFNRKIGSTIERGRRGDSKTFNSHIQTRQKTSFFWLMRGTAKQFGYDCDSATGT